MPRISNAAVGLACAAAIALSSAVAFAMGGTPTETADDKYDDAVALIKKSDYKGAIGLLEDVLAKEPRNADALNYVGYSYRKLGYYDQAISFYKRALDVEPEHKGANEYIGEAYLGMQQPTMAEMHLQRLSKICGMDCTEYKELKTAIESFKKNGRLPQSSANW